MNPTKSEVAFQNAEVGFANASGWISRAPRLDLAPPVSPSLSFSPMDNARTSFVLPIDSDFHPICEPIAATKGGVASVAVHPREVFCEAIRWRAHAVIVAHNHPSGDPTPSERDMRLTQELLATAKVVRIHILDHLVIAGNRYASIRSKGELSFA